MFKNSLFQIAVLFAAPFVASCATDRAGNGSNGADIPAFALKALASPHAQKANFFVSPDGRIVRSTVYVSREGIPAWVHGLADEKIGKGEDGGYEVEVYPDGSEVYEIYRKIDGKEKQLSARPDKKVYYIGTEHPKDQLPSAVSGAVAKLKDFQVEKCVAKEGPDLFEYHVRGTMGGASYRARIGRDGKMIALQRRIPAEVEIETAR